MGERPDGFKGLEQDVFKALENQKRRDVLRLIGEKKGITFTDLLNASKISDSPTLSYHLRELAPFIEQKEGRYQLTSNGQGCLQPVVEDGRLWQSCPVPEKTFGGDLWKFAAVVDRHRGGFLPGCGYNIDGHNHAISCLHRNNDYLPAF